MHRSRLMLSILLLPAVALAQHPPGTNPTSSTGPSASSPAHTSPSASASSTTSSPVPSHPASSGSTTAHSNHDNATTSSPKRTETWSPSRDAKPGKDEMAKSERKTKNDERKFDEPKIARAPCKKEPCTTPAPPSCAQGQTTDKNGKCVAAPAARNATNTATNAAATRACPPGSQPFGVACETQCPAGQTWTGNACADCLPFESRGSLIRTEAFGVKSQMEEECRKNPNGQRCLELTAEHDSVVQRYRMLLNEAPSACRVAMPDPLTL